MRVLVVYECGSAPSDRGITFVEEALGHGRLAPHPLASHVFIVVVTDNDLLIGIEAVPPKVRTFSPAEKAGRTLRAYELPCSHDQAVAILDAGTQLVGRPYSYEAIVAALLYAATGTEDHWYGDSTARVDCIALTADVIRGAGVEFCGQLPATDLTPAAGEQWTAAHCPRVINWLPAAPTPAVTPPAAA